MTADVKRKDKNNFITIILNKVILARDFHQRVALSITSKSILNHIVLKFYLRRRYNNLYLYTRIQDRFSNKTERHNFYRDLKILIPELEIKGKKGSYIGLILNVTYTNESLVQYLKLIAMFARPQDFYKVSKKDSISYANYITTSKIPIHINIRNSTRNKLQNSDILWCLDKLITKRIQDENTI